MNRTSVKRTTILMAAPLMAATLAVAAPAQAADTDTPTYRMFHDQTVRAGISPSSAKIGTVWGNESVRLLCQDHGSNGKLVSLVEYQVDGAKAADGTSLFKAGFVPDSALNTGRRDAVPGVKFGDCPPAQAQPGAPYRAAKPTPVPGPEKCMRTETRKGPLENTYGWDVAEIELVLNWCTRDGVVTKVEPLNPNSAMRILNGAILDQGSAKTVVEVAAVGTPAAEVWVTGSARRKLDVLLGIKGGAEHKGLGAEGSASTTLSAGNATLDYRVTLRGDGTADVTP